MRCMIWCMMFVLGCTHGPDLTVLKTEQKPCSQPVTATQNHPAYLPNMILTPGKVSAGWTLDDTKQAGGTQSHRNVPESLKKAVWERYGYDKTIGPYHDHSGEFEIDHRLMNALGGSSTIENLWPEPYNVQWGAHIKDRLEDRILAKVKSGKMTLKQGQDVFLEPDWTKVYIREGLSTPPNISAVRSCPDDDHE